MMNGPMSDERLVGFRRDVVSQVASAGGSTRHSDAYTEMLDEIDRLRAEVERLLRENLELRMIPVFEEHRS